MVMRGLSCGLIQEAKQSLLLNLKRALNTPFIKIRAVRFPDLDGEPPAGHYWDDDRVRLILVRDYCWYCADVDEVECQYCVANEYCER